MGRWTVPYHGATEEFLRAHVNHEGDDYLIWPYSKNALGYGQAVIGGAQHSAHHWMCRLAHGEPYLIWRHAAHRCDNPSCVNPSHLRWATHAENMADKERNGTVARGENNGRTWLTEDDVRAIRAAPPFYKPLMEKYGLTRHAISKIRSGKRWRHVETPEPVRIGQHEICRNGHAYDEKNTRWSSGGYRQCRACDRERARSKRAIQAFGDENGVRWTDEAKDQAA